MGERGTCSRRGGGPCSACGPSQARLLAGRQQRAMSIKEDRAPKSEALGGGNIFTGTMKVIKEYGASDVWRQMRQCKEAKVGTLVGTDALGNRRLCAMAWLAAPLDGPRS